MIKKTHLFATFVTKSPPTVFCVACQSPRAVYYSRAPLATGSHGAPEVWPVQTETCCSLEGELSAAVPG